MNDTVVEKIIMDKLVSEGFVRMNNPIEIIDGIQYPANTLRLNIKIADDFEDWSHLAQVIMDQLDEMKMYHIFQIKIPEERYFVSGSLVLARGARVAGFQLPAKPRLDIHKVSDE